MQRWCRASVLVLLASVAVMGCGEAEEGEVGGESSAQPARTAEQAPAAEASGRATAEVSEAMEPGTVAVEPGTTPSPGEATGARPPGGVAPAPGVGADRKNMKNWMLLEFVDPVTQADLDWLSAVGFRVDTVMGDRMVRGWLEKAEGAPKLTGDERIARIRALMR